MNTHTVTIYSTNTCHFCTLAKQYLTEKGVSFTDKDVGSDADARAEMIARSKQMGVPVIVIDNTVVVGFQPDAFDELLAA